uniref:Uncharacterized protein n=1 Tax=Geladintestivirus 1 TaxID=3233133 RepID=A0AAU8MHN6_9CAUD
MNINPQKIAIATNNQVNSELNKEEEEKTLVEEKTIDMEAPYIDERKVTISPVQNYSNYRKVNALALGMATLVIGSSVNSSRILSSNKDEVEAYFPQLLGLNPTHPNFMSRVKSWLSNIRFIVNENTPLDTTFHYNHYKDYLEIKKKENAINEEFDNKDKSDIGKLKEAIKRKISQINALEASKAKLGSPRNIEEYLIYRHCLLYPDVAKDVALIHTDASIRFYIKDEIKEKEREEKLIRSRQQAMRNYVELLANDNKFNSIYVHICSDKHYNVTEYLLKTRFEKEKIIMDMLNERPDKFNKYCADRHIETKAFIETLIARGELSQSEHNQNIYTSDGEFIAGNLKEAVAYFNNPDNKDIRTMYENKIKFI